MTTNTVTSPLNLLEETKSSMESIISKLLSTKQNKNPNNKSETRELLTQMFLNFINLRQANRDILLQEDKSKSETRFSKSLLDLQNLVYEKNHYLKANKSYKDFVSKYQNIDLVFEQEFNSQTLSRDENNNTSHDLMLKRLNFELHQRKELCKIREELEERKKSLVESNAERKKFLLSLPVCLKSLKKAALPVQKELSLGSEKKLKGCNLAELLPRPLYVVYSRFMAQKEAFGESIDVEVSGSFKDAQVYAREQAEESPRLEDDRRKRPKKNGNEEAGLYQVHPLKIKLHVYDDEIPDAKSRKLVVVEFEYLLKLNVVCAGIDGSENNILCSLFPDDAGLEPPHQSAKLILGNKHAFDEMRTSRPYKWAQHLAGIEILPEMSPFLTDKDTHTAKGYGSASDQHNVQTVLQRIRSQKKAKLTLV